MNTQAINQWMNKCTAIGPYYYYAEDRINGKSIMAARNKTLNQFFGFDHNQCSTTDIQDNIHPDDVDYVQACENYINLAMYRIYSKNLLDFKASYCYRIKCRASNYVLIHHQYIPLKINNRRQISRALRISTNIEHVTSINSRTVSVFGLNGMASFIQIDPFASHDFSGTTLNFTERELEVIKCMSDGETARKIAALLNISEHTVKTHKKNLMAKSDCKNQTELIAVCMRKKII